MWQQAHQGRAGDKQALAATSLREHAAEPLLATRELANKERSSTHEHAGGTEQENVRACLLFKSMCARQQVVCTAAECQLNMSTRLLLRLAIAQCAVEGAKALVVLVHSGSKACGLVYMMWWSSHNACLCLAAINKGFCS